MWWQFWVTISSVRCDQMWAMHPRWCREVVVTFFAVNVVFFCVFTWVVLSMICLNPTWVMFKSNTGYSNWVGYCRRPSTPTQDTHCHVTHRKNILYVRGGLYKVDYDVSVFISSHWKHFARPHTSPTQTSDFTFFMFPLPSSPLLTTACWFLSSTPTLSCSLPAEAAISIHSSTPSFSHTHFGM